MDSTSADHRKSEPRTSSPARVVPRTTSKSRTIPETDFGSSPIRARSMDFEMSDAHADVNEEEEKDLAQLEELMVPKETPSVLRNRDKEWEPVSNIKRSKYTTGLLTNAGWQPLDTIRPSKYTTGMLTTSGWQSIHNPVGDASAHRVSRQKGSIVENYGPASPDDAPEANKTGIDIISTDNNKNSEEDTPWLDEKYFEHNGYLDYVQGRERKTTMVKSSPVASNAMKKKQTKLKVVEMEKEEDVNEPVAEGLEGFHLQRPRPKAIRTEPPSDQRLHVAPVRGDRPSTLTSPFQAVGTRKPADAADVADENANTTPLDTPDHSPTTNHQLGEWELLSGDTSLPHTGKPTPDKLVITMRNTSTGELETSTFSKIPHINIDWNNKMHVQEISNLRCNIFRQRGFILRSTNIWYTPLEDAWLLLFTQKVRAVVEAGYLIKTPGPQPTTDVFNAFFAGKVLKDEAGGDLLPRTVRDETSIRGKYATRALRTIRDGTRKLLEGRKGEKLYVPVITEEELSRFLDDGVVGTDDPTDASKNAALGADDGKATRKSPKRKRGEKDFGEQEIKRAKQPEKKPVKEESRERDIASFFARSTTK